MSSIRKIKQRQNYHHHNFKSIAFSYTTGLEYLYSMFPGVDVVESPCVGEFRGTATFSLPKVAVMSDVPRLSELRAFRTKGKIGKSIKANLRAADVALTCQRVTLVSKLMDAIVADTDSEGPYVITDPVLRRYLERDGELSDNIGVTLDLRCRDRVYRHSGIKYHVTADSVTFYFEHKKD